MASRTPAGTAHGATRRAAERETERPAGRVTAERERNQWFHVFPRF